LDSILNEKNGKEAYEGYEGKGERRENHRIVQREDLFGFEADFFTDFMEFVREMFLRWLFPAEFGAL
jgi:hypothetical protein